MMSKQAPVQEGIGTSCTGLTPRETSGTPPISNGASGTSQDSSRGKDSKS